MKKLGVKIFGLAAFAVILFESVFYAQTAPGKMDLYLLIGQSNMAGRGVVTASDQLVTPGVWVINAANEWIPAVDPLHYDKPTAVGVGPGLEFARQVHKRNPKRDIGIIPCAIGGSRITDWDPGVKHDQTGIYPYDAMLARVKEAMKHGRLKAILWHQGEGDSSPERVALYEQRLEAFFKRLRKDIGAKKVPIILGTLGDFYEKKNPSAVQINKIILNFPAKHPHFSVATSVGLNHKGDTTHFDAESAREFGRRYAEALWAIGRK